MLRHGAEVNFKGEYGKTALHCAAEKGFASTTQLLLENGAEVNAEDIIGKSALDRASGSDVKSILLLFNVIASYENRLNRRTAKCDEEDKGSASTEDQGSIKCGTPPSPDSFPSRRKSI